MERAIVSAYLASCIAVGLLASRKVVASREEYWVAGRRIGTWVNAVAIMATLASGGSIVGVMGLAYARGIPATLALFAGAVLGFPLASVLVAKPLRNFGRITITDFLAHRYPHPIVRYGVPLLILASFTVYIVAQMKAAGITAEALLGIRYEVALTLATLVFVAYVSIGGMLAVTWTDVLQGLLMTAVVMGVSVLLVGRYGSPLEILASSTSFAPDLGAAKAGALASDIGSFVLWAAAVPVIPHVVMRVFTARDARGARMSLNCAMIVYSALILAAVLVIVPIGKQAFPGLADPDEVFLRVMETEFPPVVRGLAVAAVLAAVMSTTDALLLACSSAVAHDLLGPIADRRGWSQRSMHKMYVAVAWAVGLLAMIWAYSPPALITQFYSAAIGVLSAALFVPVIAGLWWRRANRSGGAAALVAGAAVYCGVHFTPGTPPLSAILFALPASALAMFVCGRFGTPDPPELIAEIEGLHR